MTGPNGESMFVIPMKPRGCVWVRCPSCDLHGWKDANDLDPMFCPHCFVESVPAVPEPEMVREPECVANWPDCANGEYNPKCCRFPKSCSVQWVSAVPEHDE